MKPHRALPTINNRNPNRGHEEPKKTLVLSYIKMLQFTVKHKNTKYTSKQVKIRPTLRDTCLT